MKWMGSIALAAALGVAAAPPALAQDEQADKLEAAQMMGALQDMFKSDPLTAEQQARLPAARALMLAIMPPGTMGEMFSGMFKRILDPLTKLAEQANSADVARQLGQENGSLELTEAQAARAAMILDPGARERNRQLMDTVQQAIAKAIAASEPDMREGMAQAYAVNFDDAQLADIAAFFATPSGTAYARRSFTLAGDPHVLAASMKSLPRMLAGLKEMEQEVKPAKQALPRPRGYGELTPSERQELASLTGLTQAQIKSGMDHAAQDRASKTKGDDETE